HRRRTAARAGWRRSPRARPLPWWPDQTSKNLRRAQPRQYRVCSGFGRILLGWRHCGPNTSGPGDVGAERPQGPGEVGIAPVDVLAVVDDRLLVGCEPGEGERRTSPDVGRAHRRSRQPFDTTDDRVPALRPHIGTHTGQLVDELEAAVVHVLGDD